MTTRAGPASSRAVDSGLIIREGRGLKIDPYLYWLPDSEERWRSDRPHLPDLPPMRQQLAQSRDPKKQAALDDLAYREACAVLEKAGKRKARGGRRS